MCAFQDLGTVASVVDAGAANYFDMTKPRIELKYDEERDSFYIDCGPLENVRHILNLILYANEKLREGNDT